MFAAVFFIVSYLKGRILSGRFRIWGIFLDLSFFEAILSQQEWTIASQQVIQSPSNFGTL